MLLPASSQRCVELTNFVRPLARTALGDGALSAAWEAVQHSGSDELTELKLVHILGRLRLDTAFSTDFCRTVAPSSGLTALSCVIKDLVLESGPGPTVSQALTSNNPALLSAVAQLSFLSWSLDAQSLAQAITLVVEEALLESQGSTANGLDYNALLGTIVACQQQTAAFSWEPYYKAVQIKCHASLPSEHGEVPLLISHRSVPLVILKALLRFLEPVQRLPDEYSVEISCGSEGVGSVVVWCHYLLGLSIDVKMDGGHICFGDKPHQITIHTDSSSERASVTLVERASPNGVLVALQNSDFDPLIPGDERTAARGFLKAILERRGLSTEYMVREGAWIVSECRGLLLGASESNVATSKGDLGAASGVNVNGHRGLGHPVHELVDEILPAVAFLLDIDLQTADLAQQPLSAPLLSKERNWKSTWPSIVLLVVAFARVLERDSCRSMPLSLDAFYQLRYPEVSVLPSCQTGGLSETLPLDTVRCFEILCRLLLGRRYSERYCSEAFLVSERGWSIFFGTMDANDPAGMPCSRLHIKFGVPARHGVRKARIVDGMARGPSSRIKPDAIKLEAGSDLLFRPGVWTSKFVGTQVGYEGLDALAAVQVFDWTYGGPGGKIHKQRLGFREKQELAMVVSVLPNCECPGGAGASEAEVRRSIDELLWDSSLPGAKAANPRFDVKYPMPGADISKTPERVFCRNNTWYFFVSGEGPARWLALEVFQTSNRQTSGGSVKPQFIRGAGCCIRCAVKAAPSPGLVLL